MHLAAIMVKKGRKKKDLLQLVTILSFGPGDYAFFQIIQQGIERFV